MPLSQRTKDRVTVAVADKVAGTELAAAIDGWSRKLLGPYVRDNVAASLTDSRLGLGATGATVQDVALTRAGWLVGISLSSTVAPAGSTLTVSVFKNGALLHSSAVLPVPAGATLGHYINFDRENANLALAAGDRVGIAITTDGSWTATTADIAVTVEVED